eukprot:TRINITY_DN326_c0_g1_i2.p1 TRINITY_DN326_c0_g1~~TRINITY_DN326_c0_g1_i2.p1  ORF type:complete len:1593 (-),score=419.22 TRINITY_DN326_c0_g1_i2:30-4808(-)
MKAKLLLLFTLLYLGHSQQPFVVTIEPNYAKHSTTISVNGVFDSSSGQCSFLHYQDNSGPEEGVKTDFVYVDTNQIQCDVPLNLPRSNEFRSIIDYKVYVSDEVEGWSSTFAAFHLDRSCNTSSDCSSGICSQFDSVGTYACRECVGDKHCSTEQRCCSGTSTCCSDPLVSEIVLSTRTFTPDGGINPVLHEKVDHALNEGREFLHAIFQFDSIPALDQVNTWEESGFFLLSYLQYATYIVRFPLENYQEFMDFAVAVEPLEYTDKVDNEWLMNLSEPSTLTVFIGTHKYGDSLDEFLSTFTEQYELLEYGIYKADIQSTDVVEILSEDLIAFVELYEIQYLSDAREHTGIYNVHDIDISYSTKIPTYGYSGYGINLATNEQIYADHDDFWNHDATTGAKTTPRYTGGYGNSLSATHGSMTAGLMLGNGWKSSDHNGFPFKWRGAAPEATLVTGNADIYSASYTQSSGSYTSNPHNIDNNIYTNKVSSVYAVANNGISQQYCCGKGYYSVLTPAKNPLTVGLIAERTYKWASTSIGPTHDGRLKPDISAPAIRNLVDDDHPDNHMLFDYVKFTPQSGSQITWNFNTNGDSEGWGDPSSSWYLHEYLNSMNVINGNMDVYFTWTDRARIGTITDPSGNNLNILGQVGDTLQFRYKFTPPLNNLRQTFGKIAYSSDPACLSGCSGYRSQTIPLIPDGNWHIATVVLSDVPWYNGFTYKSFAIHPINGLNGMLSPNDYNTYGRSSGSSAASPLVAGSMALMLQKFRDEFSIDVTDKSINSPFNHVLPSSGAPYPSTYKAIMIHSARDLAHHKNYLEAWGSEPINPDTQDVTQYGKGPDWPTGYGSMDIEKAFEVIDSVNSTIYEGEMPPSFSRIYTVEVPDNIEKPLKATLVWDDPAGSYTTPTTQKKLVNDMDIFAISPSSNLVRPLTLPFPYIATPSTPVTSDPNPINVADTKVPASSTIVDEYNNVEQLYIENPEPGTWTIHVSGSNFNLPVNQRYSLIIGEPNEPVDDVALAKGKICWISDRGNFGTNQVFSMNLQNQGNPTQLTNENLEVRHPAWSPDGNYIAFIYTTVIVGSSYDLNYIRIIDENGNQVANIDPPTGSQRYYNYPQWSKNGKYLVVSAYDSWTNRNLLIIEFPAPYDFSSYTSRVLADNWVLGHNPTDAEFSPDGKWIYYHADSPSYTGALFMIPFEGGTPRRIFANGEEETRAYQLSVSTDGGSLMYNSEKHKDDPVTYLDEEVLRLDILAGVSYQITKRSGHQYAKYAIQGNGQAIIQTNEYGNNEFTLWNDGYELEVDVNDPTDVYNDGAPSWFLSAPDTVSVSDSIPICLNEYSKAFAIEICNPDVEDREYRYTLESVVSTVPDGYDKGIQCSVMGPTKFEYVGENPVTVIAQSCQTVIISVDTPDSFSSPSSGDRACFEVQVQNLYNNYMFRDYGAIVDRDDYCVLVQGGPGGSYYQLLPQMNKGMKVLVSGNTKYSSELEYEMKLVDNYGNSPIYHFNDQANGEPLVGTVAIKEGAETVIDFTIYFDAKNTGDTYYLEVSEKETGELLNSILTQIDRSSKEKLVRDDSDTEKHSGTGSLIVSALTLLFLLTAL